MRTISIPKGARHINSGSYGSYYKINNKRGIKVIWHSRIDTVTKEAFYLRTASKFGLAPKCYEVVKVLGSKNAAARSWTNYGLIVQHINGTPTRWYVENAETTKERLELDKQLRKIGIINRDLFGNNVRKTRRGYVAVDFTPAQCRYTK